MPSPATSSVFLATSLTSSAPIFSYGSSSSISLAMDTPSLVIVGAPHFFSRTTLRPLGPSVTLTASASGVHAPLEAAAGLLVESNQLCHVASDSLPARVVYGPASAPATDGPPAPGPPAPPASPRRSVSPPGRVTDDLSLDPVRVLDDIVSTLGPRVQAAPGGCGPVSAIHRAALAQPAETWRHDRVDPRATQGEYDGMRARATPRSGRRGCTTGPGVRRADAGSPLRSRTEPEPMG